jgi:hypothetical protein
MSDHDIEYLITSNARNLFTIIQYLYHPEASGRTVQQQYADPHVPANTRFPQLEAVMRKHNSSR